MRNIRRTSMPAGTRGPTRAILPITALAIAVACPLCHQSRAQPPEARKQRPHPLEEKASIWMKQKLASSRDILEGMTLADYDQIEKNARAMQLVAYLEGWRRADVPGYKEQLRAFSRANGTIIRAAQRKDLDGATLAYAQLMISCVQCHAIVRDAPK